MKQLMHKEFKQRQIKANFNIGLILENIEHDENIGSAFRLADAFCVKKIFIVSNRQFNAKKIEKTARNCTNTVPYQVFESVQDAISEATKMGQTVISVELCDESVPLRDFDVSAFDGVALLVGNERAGVSQTALDLSKAAVHIDMFGNNSSLNVATALAIALYGVTEKYLN